MSLEKLKKKFVKVYLVDFEFMVTGGEKPIPSCMVVKEFFSKETKKIWLAEGRLPACPFSTGSESLFVAYFALAEFDCFHYFGWKVPENILDLYVEFRNLTNGKNIQSASLLSALGTFRLESIDYIEKEEMRQLAMRGGPYSEEEKKGLLEYCETDVVALEKLLPKMLKYIDLDRALLRGNYIGALSHAQFRGIPIDMKSYRRLSKNWDSIRVEVIKELDEKYKIYEGTTFRQKRFEEYLNNKRISWPRNPTGSLKLDSETFKDMSLIYPELEDLRLLRELLGKLKLNKLTVGSDGRNRTILSPFRSKTGRNQPSNSKNIFGLPSWVRSIIKPEKGKALAYIDWSQQEFGIAASLSKDPRMMEAYNSSDPYIKFAQQAGKVPMDATKVSHPRERELFKTCSLGVLYGMGVKALAKTTGEPEHFAKELLRLHRSTYKVFWDWSDRTLEQAMLKSNISTVFGWGLHIDHRAKEKSLRNFPMQANGAEMLRVAVILMIEAGVDICMTVHDAILIESSIENLEENVEKAKGCMKKASEIILNGFSLKSDAEVYSYPAHFGEGKQNKMWERVQGVMAKVERGCNTGVASSPMGVATESMGSV